MRKFNQPVRMVDIQAGTAVSSIEATAFFDRWTEDLHADVERIFHSLTSDVHAGIPLPHVRKSILDRLYRRLAQAEEEIEWDRVVQSSHQVVLTPRQYEILRWMHAGKRPKEIAYALGCELSTVRTHIRDLCARLEASGSDEAIRKAHHAGIL